MNNEIDQKVGKRVAWVDVLRCLGIFAIYLGHFGEAAGKLYPFVFIYHVPLFFFVSGFFGDIKYKQSLFKFIKKKFVNIMIPYFIFSFLFEIINALIHNYNPRQIWNETFPFLFAVRNTLAAPSLWFFSCLFLVEIIYRILLIIIKNKYIIFFIIFFLHLFVSFNEPKLFWNLDSASIYLIYYAIGNILYPVISKYRYKNIASKFKIIYVLLVIGSLVFTAICYFKSPLFIFPYIINFPEWIHRFYYLFSSCILIFFNLQIAYLFEKITYFQVIGKTTLIICGVENIVKDSLNVIWRMCNIPLTLNSPYAAILYTCVCLIVAYYFSFILKAVFPKIFLGEKKTI